MKKSCRQSGKIKFDSHEQAAIRAGEIITKPGNPTKELWTYRCEFCGHWHLSSSAPRDYAASPAAPLQSQH